MANNTVEYFLKHATPALVFEKYKDLAEALTSPMQWRMQRSIARGEVTHRTVYEEATYEGDHTVPDLVEWLSQYDSSWVVEVSGYGQEIYVAKHTRIPYTEEEIAAAKKFIEDHPEPDMEYIRFRVNHD